jgi:hypothetical protein
MATHSRIGIMTKNGIKSIYCHWDGYPSYVGHVLKNHYSTEEKIQDLLSLGDLSVLSLKVFPSGEHSFENPEIGVCVAYHRDRDRGEHFVEPSFLSQVEFNSEEEYNYAFIDGVWYVNGKELTDSIIEED